MPADDPVDTVDGVGEKRAEELSELGILTVEDLATFDGDGYDTLVENAQAHLETDTEDAGAGEAESEQGPEETDEPSDPSPDQEEDADTQEEASEGDSDEQESEEEAQEEEAEPETPEEEEADTDEEDEQEGPLPDVVDEDGNVFVKFRLAYPEAQAYYEDLTGNHANPAKTHKAKIPLEDYQELKTANPHCIEEILL